MQFLKSLIVKYEKIALDFFVSILASGVMTAVLQLVVYPFLAKKLNADIYGIFLTIMGVENTFISAFGNTLNNVRLVQNDKYNIYENSDFNILLISAVVVSSFIEIVIFHYIFDQSYLYVIFLIIASILGILRSYYSVIYRVILNFKKNLICNGIISIGYFLGIAIFDLLEFWPIVFIVGELLGLIYLFKDCDLVSISLSRTSNFDSTVKKYLNFLGSTAIGSALTYLDRILILPILGAEAVSLYTVSSIFGKMLGIVMLPIAGVMLGYFAQRDFKMNKKVYFTIISLSVIICTIFFVIAVIFGKWFTGILYPTLIKDAEQYIVVANLVSIIAVLGSMISPVVLKYALSIWQIYINISYGVLYIFSAIIFSRFWGLWGFCIAAGVSNFYRVCIMFIVGLVGVSKCE